jgi:hypothetical protein
MTVLPGDKSGCVISSDIKPLTSADDYSRWKGVLIIHDLWKPKRNFHSYGSPAASAKEVI